MDAPSATALPQPVNSSINALARKAIQGNFFYLFSAALMLLGCYLLMYSPSIAGTHFVKTLKALCVLQGYELLVIATALVIVKSLRVLDDAFTLLLVELIILLDPTFFANHFYLLFVEDGERISELGVVVNGVCFLLAPLKLLLLQAGLKLRLEPGVWLAFTIAAFFVYVAQINLFQPFPAAGFTRAEFFFLLAWLPLFYVLALPLGQMLRITAPRQQFSADYISAQRERLLNRLIVLLPLLLLVLHLLESGIGHGIIPSPIHLAPLLLTGGLLLSRFSKSGDPKADLRGLDLINFLALLASAALFLPIFTDPLDPVAAHKIRPVLPATIAVFGAIVLYADFYQRFGLQQALHRICALFSLSALAAVSRTSVFAGLEKTLWRYLEQSGSSIKQSYMNFVAELRSILGTVYSFCIELLAGAGTLISENPAECVLLLCLLLAVLAVFVRRLIVWYLCGMCGVVAGFGYLPGGYSVWIAEMTAALIFLFLLLEQKFDALEDKSLLNALALFGCAVSLYRFITEPATLTTLIVFAEILFLAISGCRKKYRDYLYLAQLDGLIFLAAGGYFLQLHRHTAHIAVIGALALFIAGVVVTFTKTAILRLLEQRHGEILLSAPAQKPDAD